MTLSSLILSLVLAVAQSAASSPLPPPQTVASRPSVAVAPYEDGGRRDPFVSLIAPPVEHPAIPAAPSRVGPGGTGIASRAIAEVTVRGIVQSGATSLAILETPDGKTFLVHRQDRLRDGVITAIDRDSVVFLGETQDAAGARRTSEIRKPLRAAGGGW